jgi:hypothetical protein
MGFKTKKKTLSIVAKKKVLFTVNITRNRMQNPIIKINGLLEMALD